MKQLALLILLVCAAAIGGWSYYQMTNVAPPSLETSRIYDEARDIDPFTLDGTHGDEVQNSALEGQWTLLFTGYTYCPDICPTTMAQLKSRWDDIAGVTDDPVQVWMISVDPKRDDVERLANYVGFFGDGFFGVRAEHPELFPFVRNIGLMYSMPDEDEENYLVNHSASIILVNPDGQQHAIFRAEQNPGTLPTVNPNDLVTDFQQIVRHYYRVQDST